MQLVRLILLLFLGLLGGFLIPYAEAQSGQTIETQITVIPILRTNGEYSLTVRVGIGEGNHPSSGLIQWTYPKPDGALGYINSETIPLTADQHFFSYTATPSTRISGKSTIVVSLTENGVMYKGSTQSYVVGVVVGKDETAFVTSWESDLILDFEVAPQGRWVAITPASISLTTSGDGVVEIPSPQLTRNWQRVTPIYEIAANLVPDEGIGSQAPLKLFIRIPDTTGENPDYRVQRVDSYTESYPSELLYGAVTGDYYVVTLTSLQGGFSLVKRESPATANYISLSGELVSSFDQSPVSGRGVTVHHMGAQRCDQVLAWPEPVARATTQADGHWKAANLEPGWVGLNYWETATEPPTVLGSFCLLLDQEDEQTAQAVSVYTKPYVKLVPQAGPVRVGSEFEVPLQVNTVGAEGLTRAHVDLEFDPVRLEFVGLRSQYGTIDYGTSANFINQTGTLYLDTSLPETPLGESFVPVRVVFRAKGPLTSSGDAVVVVTKNTVTQGSTQVFEFSDPNARLYFVVIVP